MIWGSPDEVSWLLTTSRTAERTAQLSLVTSPISCSCHGCQATMPYSRPDDQCESALMEYSMHHVANFFTTPRSQASNEATLLKLRAVSFFDA